MSSAHPRETDENRAWLRRRLNEQILVEQRPHVKEIVLDSIPSAESQLALAKTLTDEDINRFIRARPDNPQSLQLLEKHVAIRAKVRPWEATRSMNEEAFATGLCRYAGWTNCGWPILMVDFDQFDVDKLRLDNIDLYVMSVFEGLIAYYMGQGVEKYVCMINLRNVGNRMTSAHRRVLRRVIQVFAPFPEWLGGVVFLNPPSNFATVWWLVKCILPAPFLAKVRVVENVEEYDIFIDPAAAEKDTVVGGLHDEYPPCAPYTELAGLGVKPPPMNDVVPRFGQTIPRPPRRPSLGSEAPTPTGKVQAPDVDELPRVSSPSKSGGDTRSAGVSWFGLDCCGARDRFPEATEEEEPASPRAPPRWPRVAQEVLHEDEPWEDPWTTSLAQAAHQTLEVYEDTADAAESALNTVTETVNQTFEEVAVTVEKAVEDVGQALQDAAESVSEVVDATSQYVSESMDAAYDKTCSVFADLVAFTTFAARWMDA